MEDSTLDPQNVPPPKKKYKTPDHGHANNNKQEVSIFIKFWHKCVRLDYLPIKTDIDTKGT